MSTFPPLVAMINPPGTASSSPYMDNSPTSTRPSKNPKDVEHVPKKVDGTREPYFTPPTYTMKDIHDAIPPHCFQRSTKLSLLYIIRDLLISLTFFLLATQITHISSQNLRYACWAAYAFTQGLIFTGLWEIAHECGHQALFPSKNMNYGAGLLVHSALLVPFHSWRITHSQHHKATNNIEQDIAFVPDTREVWMKGREERSPKVVFGWWDLVEDMPVVNLLILLGHQIIAWPIYITINNFALPRMRAVPWWTRSHFYAGGDGPNFKPSNRDDVIISTVGVAITAFSLWVAGQYFGSQAVFLYYVAPWMWTNHWILTITFLQHTDPTLPYYPTSTWTFLRGCASTIDRDFGFIGKHFFHGAIEYHVLHHHASRIPFYHAKEATDAIKGVMGTHYKRDGETFIMWAFWRNYNKCAFVEEKDGGSKIFFFGDKMMAKAEGKAKGLGAGAQVSDENVVVL